MEAGAFRWQGFDSPGEISESDPGSSQATHVGDLAFSNKATEVIRSKPGEFRGFLEVENGLAISGRRRLQLCSTPLKDLGLGLGAQLALLGGL